MKVSRKKEHACSLMGVRPRRPAARRLTLAPTPAALVSEDVEDWEEVVHWCEEASLSSGKEDRRRADPLAGCRPSCFGSKFWPLAEELGSDDEDEVDLDAGDGRIHVASHSSSLPPLEVELTPNGCHVSVAGLAHGAGGRSGLDGQLLSSTRKPWRGPLPPARTSPELTLGDALAKARRIPRAAGEGRDRTGSITAPPSSSPATAKAPGVWMSGGGGSNFESPRHRARDLGRLGRTVGTVASGPSKSLTAQLGGRTAQFRSDGKAKSFTAGGTRDDSARRLVPLPHLHSGDSGSCL